MSEEALQIAEKIRWGKRKRERYTQMNAEFEIIAGRDKKAINVINAKKQRKTIERGKLEISSRKLEIPREHFL